MLNKVYSLVEIMLCVVCTKYIARELPTPDPLKWRLLNKCAFEWGVHEKDAFAVCIPYRH
jgi:hypothetical protein